MTKAEKRLAKLRQSRVDVTPDELKAILLQAGFELARQSGSHMTFSHPRLDQLVTVPFHRPVKLTYIKLAHEAVEEVLRDGDRK